ncbi:MAG TPA: penicillin-binding transpeptidase domain-containing protein [Pyrinomonadaceae bacterium]|jgi:membrane peptidoglycan carboxypeptidase
MTLTVRPPFFSSRVALGFFLLITLFSTGTISWAKGKRAAAPARSARADQKRSRADKGREKSAKNSRADKRGRREEARASDNRKGRNARETRAALRDDRRGGRRLSRRERMLAEAQRRRELEEARRRAEAARQAAIARQRAIEQAMRDDVAASISRDDTTGEDMEVRRAAVAALGNRIGTVVVMNPKNGRVYSIVNQEWALRRGFKPCSTIKLVTGLAGLTEKVISPYESVDVAAGSYNLDLTSALAYSNNGYFQRVGGQVGFDRIMNYAREMGLGERTGINHVNESAGRVPVYKSGWAVNRMCSHGDDFEVTPIQLATLTSAIANGGELLTPHLPRTPQEDVNFRKIVRRRLNVPQEAYQRLVPGMIGAVNYGSGKKAYNPLETIAGKTGTCIGDGQWLGLFTSYAPVHDPQLAVVVITRGPDARKHIPAAIAGTLYRALNYRFNPASPSGLANTPVVPRPRIDPKAAAAISDEDREEEAADQAGVAGADDTTTGAGNANDSKVKSTLMTVPARQPEVRTGPAREQASPTLSQPAGERPRRATAP